MSKNKLVEVIDKYTVPKGEVPIILLAIEQYNKIKKIERKLARENEKLTEMLMLLSENGRNAYAELTIENELEECGRNV